MKNKLNYVEPKDYISPEMKKILKNDEKNKSSKTTKNKKKKR